jgi:acyl-CoA synthetase (AMP-forming)/AMP-acid ligase II
MHSYYNQPAETAKAFTADGYMRTGDIGVLDDEGYTRIIDRKKDMMVVSGFNVYPNELENVISMCPGVLECAAVGVKTISRANRSRSMWCAATPR